MNLVCPITLRRLVPEGNSWKVQGLDIMYPSHEGIPVLLVERIQGLDSETSVEQYLSLKGEAKGLERLNHLKK